MLGCESWSPVSYLAPSTGSLQHLGLFWDPFCCLLVLVSLSFILNISDSPPPANPPISFPVYSLFSPTQGNPYCDFHPHKLVLLILEPYINGITQHIFLGIWLILLNRMSVKFLRGVVYISSFLFIF